MRKHLLHKVFEPQSVAIVGASERPQSVGTQLLDNLIDSGFQGDIYPVNPGYQSLRGLRCYPAISAVDHAIDLVVIVIPAKAIPGVLHECGEAGVGAVIIVSAGFAEVGSRGRSLQDEIVDIARTYRIPLVGPNCLGIVRPSVGLNASFAKNRVGVRDDRFTSDHGQNGVPPHVRPKPSNGVDATQLGAGQITSQSERAFELAAESVPVGVLGIFRVRIESWPIAAKFKHENRTAVSRLVVRQRGTTFVHSVDDLFDLFAKLFVDIARYWQGNWQ